MRMQTGSCTFGLWRLTVSWEGSTVHQVRFGRTGPAGPVPIAFTKFLAGKTCSFSPLVSSALEGDSAYAKVYAAVSEIPYGETRTYGEIAESVNTHPRVVGNAMARNPTALIIPCHRVVASDGSIGGFTPDPSIKAELLLLEKRVSGSDKRDAGDDK